MASRFKPLSLSEFSALLNRFPFSRRINAVHMHHTWRPNHKDYQGEASIEAMWRYHTQTNGWDDIAQHVTIDPDGTIWTGRNWNQAPASATGHNGNSKLGPFMFEMIGDFDKGRDRFEGKQQEAALQVAAQVLHHFGLPANALQFHRAMSTKTCPGTGIDYNQTLAAVTTIMSGLGTRSASGEDKIDKASEGLLALLQAPFAETTTRSSQPAAHVLEESELAEERMAAHEVAQLTELVENRGLFGPARFPAKTEELFRAHVINLAQGNFSTEGAYRTTPAEVETIFSQRLEQALREAQTAQRPLHLLFYAHGGLVAERSGLESAAQYIPWWLQNHIYPLYFVWETGLMGTLGALLRGQRRRAAGTRGFTDWTDRLIEEAVRAPGRPIWKNMKDSAAWAAAPGGGSHYVAQQLAAFCQRHTAELTAGTLQLHAVGHSAGSIFHAHFLPLAWQLGVPAFQSLHLLAPAIRVDEFQRRLAGEVGKKITQLTLYTMQDRLEQDDQCGGIYRKSLLYLLYYALESEENTAILGLDISLRGTPALRQLLGLDSSPNQAARVIWSITTEPSGRSSSSSTTHGGFDNDAPTMESLVRRVLNQDSIVAFPTSRTAATLDPWSEPVALPEALLLLAQEQIAQQTTGSGPSKGGNAASSPLAKAAPGSNGSPTSTKNDHIAPADNKDNTPHRRALCIGIDEYPDAPLSGCVADAKLWESNLAALGFETQLLVNSQATRDALLQRLTDLVTTSKAGDVVVLQYAGHGTQVPDQDGDEPDNLDEALCAYDYAEGGLVLDDELRRVFAQIPEGVNVTCFMDCCHSESNTRKLPTGPLPSDSRKRYMALPAKAKANFLSKHPLAAGRSATTRSAAPAAGQNGEREFMRAINFTACKATQFAYESRGHGLFTQTVLPLVRNSASTPCSHREFIDEVMELFSKENPGYDQHPTIDCTTEAELLPLLKSLTLN
jgi:hypothetical protein